MSRYTSSGSQPETREDLLKREQRGLTGKIRGYNREKANIEALAAQKGGMVDFDVRRIEHLDKQIAAAHKTRARVRRELDADKGEE